MHLTIPQPDLHKILSVVTPVASARSPLPCYRHAMMEVKPGGAFECSCYNRDLGITWEGAPTRDIEPGSAAPPADLLQKIVSQLDGEVTLQLIQEKPNYPCLMIKANRSTFQLECLTVDQYAGIPEIGDGAQRITLPLTSLLRGIRGTIDCTSDQKSRPELTAIWLHVLDGELRFGSSDTHRLAINALQPTELEDMNLNIPGATAERIERCLKGYENAKPDQEPPLVEIAWTDRMISVESGEITLVSRLCEGKRPNYQRVMPKPENMSATVRCSRQDLLRALQRVGIVADRETAHRVTVVLEDGSISLESQVASVGIARDQLEAITEVKEGEVPGPVALNGHYLVEMLRRIEQDQVEIHLPAGFSPLLITGKEDATSRYVLMPMQIQS